MNCAWQWWTCQPVGSVMPVTASITCARISPPVASATPRSRYLKKRRRPATSGLSAFLVIFSLKPGRAAPGTLPSIGHPPAVSAHRSGKATPDGGGGKRISRAPAGRPCATPGPAPGVPDLPLRRLSLVLAVLLASQFAPRSAWAGDLLITLRGV